MASFRFRKMQEWRKVWESVTLNDEGKNKIRLMLEGLLFFFKYKEDMYGAGEQARVTFAKLRDPNDEDADEGWRDEANFTATNLCNAVKGRPTQSIFSEKDLNEIDVVGDKEQVYNFLVKYVEANPGEFGKKE